MTQRDTAIIIINKFFLERNREQYWGAVSALYLMEIITAEEMEFLINAR